MIVLSQLPVFHLPAQQPEEKIREEVSVTNVEVPVRVFYKGKAVDNLTRDDFSIYEDKVAQTINGFFLKKRKIKVQEIGLTTEKQELDSPSPRFFVLVFRLTNYTAEIKKGVAYLFDNILRDQDQLLVFVNDKTVFFNRDYKRVKREDILDNVLLEESVKANQRLVTYFVRIQRELEIAKTELRMVDTEGRRTSNMARPEILANFLDRYLASWIEYKRKYLLPDIDKYYNFANFLEKIDKEKWVINFYQIEMFPKMKYSGELRRQIEDIINELMTTRSEESFYWQTLSAILTEIDEELNVAKDFHADEISKLFYKIDATCHSVFCGIQKEALSQDLEYRRVSTDIENSLREITTKTGGALISTNDLESALHSISEKEDIHYMLTYAPQDAKKIGEIKVLVNNKNYDVFYDNKMRADYIKEYLDKKSALNPQIKLDDISFKEKKLFMAIGDFLMQPTKEGDRGRISVRVHITDAADKVVFEKSRLLSPEKKVTTITIDFDWLGKGEYNVLIDVSDMLTGKTAMDFLQTTIN